MSGTILVREAVRRISVLMLDISPQFRRCPERMVIDFLNDAHLAVAKFLPMSSSRKVAIRLKPGTLQSIANLTTADYRNEDGTVPGQPLIGITLLHVSNNMGADGLTPGKVVTICNREQLDRQDEDWHLPARARTVVQSYLFDPLLPQLFEVSPPVHASTAVWLRAALNAQPLKIPAGGAPGSEVYLADGGSTETIKLRDEFIDELVNYTVARLNMQDADWADAGKAALFTGMWTSAMNAKVQLATGVNPNLKRLPFAPEPVGQASS